MWRTLRRPFQPAENAPDSPEHLGFFAAYDVAAHANRAFLARFVPRSLPSCRIKLNFALASSPYPRKTAPPWRRTVCDKKKPVLTDVEEPNAKPKNRRGNGTAGFFQRQHHIGLHIFRVGFLHNAGIATFCPVLLSLMCSKPRFPSGLRVLSRANAPLWYPAGVLSCCLRIHMPSICHPCP